MAPARRAPAARLTAEQIETIIRRAEGWAREERQARIIARLDALKVCPCTRVPADWREQAEPSPNRAGDA